MVNVPQSGIFFPNIYQFAQGGVLTVQIRPTGPGTGTLNPLTGVATLNISLRISITGTAGGFDLGSGCGVGPFTLNMTTGTTSPPPPNEPITGSLYDAETGRATVVNNSFSVPGADSCGPLGAASGPLGAALGVPAPAGVNTAVLIVEANPKVTKGVNASNVPSVEYRQRTPDGELQRHRLHRSAPDRQLRLGLRQRRDRHGPDGLHHLLDAGHVPGEADRHRRSG